MTVKELLELIELCEMPEEHSFMDLSLEEVIENLKEVA